MATWCFNLHADLDPSGCSPLARHVPLRQSLAIRTPKQVTTALLLLQASLLTRQGVFGHLDLGRAASSPLQPCRLLGCILSVSSIEAQFDKAATLPKVPTPRVLEICQSTTAPMLVRRFAKQLREGTAYRLPLAYRRLSHAPKHPRWARFAAREVRIGTTSADNRKLPCSERWSPS